jgi:hypothetical protein
MRYLQRKLSGLAMNVTCRLLSGLSRCAARNCRSLQTSGSKGKNNRILERALVGVYLKLTTAVSLVALASLAATVPAWAAAIDRDPVAVTLTSPADVTATREALIDETWGTTTLPETCRP